MISTDDPYIWLNPNPSNSQPGSLSSLKVAVKDLFDIADVPTTAGNPDWLASHPVPEKTSPIVERLLSAGSIVVGKTITDELAYSLNGQNIHYGTPINPVAPNRLPGGSSSGSAVAVANGSADIGLGTDTGGSIRVPASYCGLVGYRPSHGLFSLSNMVGLAPEFDTVGWLTKDLATSFRVFQVLAEDQSVTPCISEDMFACANELIQQTQNAEVVETWLSQNPNNIKNVSEPFSMSNIHVGSETFRILQGRSIWKTHGNWILDNQPTFAKDIDERFRWCQSLTEKDEATARKQQTEFILKINAALDEHPIIIIPTTPGEAPLLNTKSEELVRYRNLLLGFTCIAGLTGLPQLHLPLFRADAPFGLSIIAAKGNDNLLFQAAKFIQEKHS